MKLEDRYKRQKLLTNIFIVFIAIGIIGFFGVIASGFLTVGSVNLEDGHSVMSDKIQQQFKRMAFAPLFMAFIIIGAIGFALLKRKQAIYKAGLDGEMAAKDIFKRLPQSYTVFYDKTIKYDGERSQADFIITGPNGIYIVESKNVSGEITGSARDKQLLATKLTQQLNTYEKTFYNPIKQVGTHVYRLAKNLNENGFKHYVQGVVLFTHASNKICVTDIDQIPIFSVAEGDVDELLAYITNGPAKKTLSNAELSAVNRYLATIS